MQPRTSPMLDGVTLAAFVGLSEHEAIARLLDLGHTVYVDDYNNYSCPLSKADALALQYGEQATVLIEFFLCGRRGWER